MKREANLISQLPEAWILRIFSYLSVTELSRCKGVSRNWKKHSSEDSLWNSFDLKTISPLLQVVSGVDWISKFGLERLNVLGIKIEDEPKQDNQRAVRLLASIKKGASITCFTIPEGLTFNKLVALTGPLSKATSKFQYIWDGFVNEKGDIAIEKTTVIWIMNSMSYNMSQKIAGDIPEGDSNQKLTVLEGSALLIVGKNSLREQLERSAGSFYISCAEPLFGYHMAIKCFHDGSIHLYRDYFGLRGF